MLHTNQLQFNLDFPMNPQNLKTEFTSPNAIMYERFATAAQSPVKKEIAPFKFKSVSNSKLSNAILLAKRDLKFARRQQMLSEFAKENALSDEEMDRHRKHVRAGMGHTTKVITISPKRSKATKSIKQKQRQSAGLHVDQQRNSAGSAKQPQELQDIKRLRLEIHQVLLKLQKTQDERRILQQRNILMMDIEEEQKLLVRHLEQMRKHSRTVYTLQQQVQVIKQDLKKEATEYNSNSKRRLLSKVAAAHRGTSRLITTYCQQLPEYSVFPDNFVAVNVLFQEVSKLIKELSLCALQLNLADVEEVERVSDLMKNIEPKSNVPPKPVAAKRSPKSVGIKERTPRRSFKSKDVSVVKKSVVKPKIPRPSFSTPHVFQRSQDVAHSLEAVDLIDRPEWRPPSNSPYKSIGPPSLGPLLETPTPRKSPRPKAVTFFSTPREHDIDTYQNEETRDIKALKSRLADELEAELKTRIQPLLKQVDDLAKSAQRSSDTPRRPEDDILETHVREIVEETRKELENFQKEQEVEEQAVQLYQRPSLDSLLLRLDAISQEEEAIRRRWQEINYDDMKKESITVTETVPKTPQGFKFTKTSTVKEDHPKEIINFIPNEDKRDYPLLTMVKTNKSELTDQSRASVLILPQSTVYAVEKGRKEFQRHLKYSFHEPKGNFNPWNMVEELSDDLLNDVVESVAREVNGMCEFYAEEIFKGEFADGPNLTDSSLMTSASSVRESLE